MKENKNLIAGSFFWKFIERFSVQITSFITTMVLARILTTDEYGTVALVTVFIAIATVFVQGGFNTALIQKKYIDNEDISTVFTFSIILVIIFYALLWLLAPIIASFYNKEILIPIVRILSLSLFLGAFNSIQVAIITRNMNFKSLFKSNLFGSIIASILSILIAVNGGGIWSMVAWYLINVILTTILMFFSVEWRPRFYFSIKKFKKLFSFGSKILISNVMVTIFQNIRSLLIGRYYSTSDLAVFNKGKQFPQVLMDGIVGSMQSVSLSSFSKMQNLSVENYKYNFRKILRMSYFIIFPLLIGIFSISRPLVIILLTDKWEGTIIFIQIFCVTYLFQPLQIICAEALKGKGMSDITLKIEIWRKTFEIILLLVTLKFGTIMIAVGALISGFLSFTITMLPNKKYLNYLFKEQLFDLYKPLLSSILMLLLIFPISYFEINYFIVLFIQIIFGIIIYILCNYLLKNKEMFDFIKFYLNKLKVGK